MNNDIDATIRQTHRYFYVDGLVEMAIGFLFLVISFFLGYWQAHSRQTGLDCLLGLGIPALTIGGALLVKQVIQALKMRVTFPRTGFVAYKEGRPSRSRWWVRIAAIIVLVIMLALPEKMNRMAFPVGALLGIVLWVLGYQVSLRRFYGVGVLSVILGSWAAFQFADEVLGTAVTFAGVGGVLFLVGSWVLWRYLRQHPVPDEPLP